MGIKVSALPSIAVVASTDTIYVVSGGTSYQGTASQIRAPVSYCSVQFDKTNDNTLANITGMSVTLLAGQTYRFEVILKIVTGATGGFQFDLGGGSASVTTLNYSVYHISGAGNSGATNSPDITSLTTVTSSATNFAAGVFYIFTGWMTVNSGGTIIPRFAQNTAVSATSSVYTASNMTFNQI